MSILYQVNIYIFIHMVFDFPFIILVKERTCFLWQKIDWLSVKWMGLHSDWIWALSVPVLSSTDLHYEVNKWRRGTDNKVSKWVQNRTNCKFIRQDHRRWIREYGIRLLELSRKVSGIPISRNITCWHTRVP